MTQLIGQKLKAGWGNYGLEAAPDPIARGYSNVCSFVLKHLLAHDRLEMVDRPPRGAPILHVTPPHRFVPVPGYRNICFSMWEGETLPKEYATRLQKADVLIVPSNFTAGVWQRSGLPRPHVVPLGVELGLYSRFSTDRPRFRRGPNNLQSRLKHRRGTQGRLRFLFLGAKVQRKGWHVLEPAWRSAFENTKASFEVQLYVKVIEAEKAKQGVRGFYENGVIFDTQDLTNAGLAELYHSADVFVFPSIAEGFGLPALEAMAAGCLVISTQAGGLEDFVSQERNFVLQRTQTGVAEYNGQKWKIPVSDPEDLGKLLRIAYETWGTAELDHRRRLGWFEARAYTWEQTANKIVEAAFAPAPRIVLTGGLR